MAFQFYEQLDSMDCGPSCLRMVAKHHGRSYSLTYLREKCYIDKTGVSLRGISEAAETIGFRSLAIKIPFSKEGAGSDLLEAPLPAVLHWNNNHFVVLYKVSSRFAWIADPASGKVKLTHDELCSSWLDNEGKGIVLLLETTPNFHELDGHGENQNGFYFIVNYLYPHKRLLIQLVLGLLLGTVFQLILPFLTQSLVDIGIDTNNLNFIYLILVGQLMLFAGQMITRFIQSWILLHISVRINVNLIADFLIKLMRLPIGFFDSKNIGDLLQRISDHKRIETFLTESSLSFLLSILNLVVFGIVLLVYSVPIFLVFAVSSVMYLSWIIIFLKKRKEIDYRAFQQLSNDHDSLIEIIQGIPEIKLQGSELKRRWGWANIQARLFKTRISTLKISQYQDAGAQGIAQSKDIFITFLAATAVLDGSITLGAMLAIQYIIGQLNAPLLRLAGFIRDAQDAKISFERLNEVHSTPDEEHKEERKIDIIPDGDIVLSHVDFKYSPIGEAVLSDVSFTIPKGKTTAVVGMSGSGKTTLIKLLLGFYEPQKGTISIDGIPIGSVYQKVWRKACGVVMQEGYIFSDTIANNIAESDDVVNYSKVIAAATQANIMDYIHSLPMGMSTMIGANGNGLSQGQKQRLLIARAIYKNPEFLFFDEATNALDAKNERVIMGNLNKFLRGKTSVIVAHRLSTVQNADRIIVLDQGKVVEQGSHEELVDAKGIYYSLVKNQLQLGV